MSEAKPFASLSSGLLARKGAAKPAMRRPNININPDNAQENGLDDLGWNDMGYDVDPDISKEAPAVKPVNPLAKAIEVPKPEVKQQQDRIAAQLQVANEFNEAKPEHNEASSEKSFADIGQDSQSAKKQTDDRHAEEKQADLEQAAVQDVQDQVEQIIPAKSRLRKTRVAKKVGTAKARAAFTLRLDPERHLKLRLACAIENISAQKFVTDALDKKLSEMNQIDHLSGQIVEK